MGAEKKTNVQSLMRLALFRQKDAGSKATCMLRGQEPNLSRVMMQRTETFLWKILAGPV